MIGMAADITSESAPLGIGNADHGLALRLAG